MAQLTEPERMALADNAIDLLKPELEARDMGAIVIVVDIKTLSGSISLGGLPPKAARLILSAYAKQLEEQPEQWQQRPEPV